MLETVIFSDGHLRATVQREQSRLWLSLDDCDHGRSWGRVPLLELEIFDKAEDRTETLTEFRIDAVEKLSQGVHVIVGSTVHCISLGMWVRLVDGELSVLVPPTEMYETNTTLFRIKCVNVLPGLLRVGSGGTLVLPIASGAVCHTAGKQKISERFMIYGEQQRWELLPLMPVCAAHSPEGGMIALAVAGAADTECRISTDGKGSGEIGFGISARMFWPDPVDLQNRELRYAPIPPTADAVHATAQRLRRHAVEDLKKPTLKQRAAESPEVAYLLEAYIMKLFFAVENRGIMMEGKPKDSYVTYRRVMNFDEAGDGLRKIHAAGIDKILSHCVGWNPRGHDGLWPSRFPIDERLGGERGFRKLIALGSELGFQVNVHDNCLSAYTSSPEFDVDTVIHDIYGEPSAGGVWGGGVTYLRWIEALSDEELERPFHQMRALGLQGALYIDAMGSPLRVNYHKKNGGPRSGYAAGVERILAAAQRVFGAVGTENGFLYAATGADFVENCACGFHIQLQRVEWPILSMIDKRVPLWQLAMHGLIVLENQGWEWKDTMRTVLFGEHPRVEWSAHPGIMPVLNPPLIAALKANYDIALKEYGYLQTLELLRHKELAAGVEQTEFEDGTKVLADFNKRELFVNGKIVNPSTEPERIATVA
jgi:hypothetical protein